MHKSAPQKVIVIHQHQEGALDEFLATNGDWIATHDVDMTSFDRYLKPLFGKFFI